ncbi:MAG TPA: CdaR family protein [Anaerovoracaceae bacterium]|nr:CdaR family protein [Anaerovoracaceae bacterium]
MQANKKKKASDSNRTITIIISIVIALILWSYVIIQVNPTKVETITRVPVQLLNEQSLTARQLAIYGDSEYMVDVVVEGRRADIIKVTSDDIVAEVDLFGWSKGENYIPVNVKVPQSLKLVEVRSAKIEVTIEDLVALSKPVIISYRGHFRTGTEAGNVDIRPAEIEVKGAKSAVEAVHEIRAYVDVADITPEGAEIQCETVPLNDGEIIVENVNLSSNYVNLSARLLYLKEVPLVVETTGETNDGYGVEVDAPKTVIIKGTKSEIGDIDSISAEPIDITSIGKNKSVNLKLLLPDNIELSKENPSLTAEVRIEQIATKEFLFSADDILLEDMAQDNIINLDPTDIIVLATGRKGIIDKLEQSQLQLYIEASDLKAGSFTVPLMVTASVPLHSVTINPSQISLMVIETEQENTVE